MKLQVIDGDGTRPASDSDPKNINGRLYDAMSTLLDNFDEMDTREQVATITAIARIQTLWAKIRESNRAATESGTAVKRYERAFAANAQKRNADSGVSTLALTRHDDDDGDELEY